MCPPPAAWPTRVDSRLRFPPKKTPDWAPHDSSLRLAPPPPPQPMRSRGCGGRVASVAAETRENTRENKPVAACEQTRIGVVCLDMKPTIANRGTPLRCRNFSANSCRPSSLMLPSELHAYAPFAIACLSSLRNFVPLLPLPGISPIPFLPLPDVCPIPTLLYLLPLPV